METKIGVKTHKTHARRPRDLRGLSSSQPRARIWRERDGDVRAPAFSGLKLSISAFGVVGTCAQVLWKYALQRVLERRDLPHSPRRVLGR